MSAIERDRRIIFGMTASTLFLYCRPIVFQLRDKPAYTGVCCSPCLLFHPFLDSIPVLSIVPSASPNIMSLCNERQSPEMAVTWWVKAAAQGFAEAQFNLAVCLLHGKGVRKDEVGAIKMLKGAAEQDHTEALCMLASLHAEGLAGLPQSKEEAISLYAAAENLGSEEARYKKLVL